MSAGVFHDTIDKVKLIAERAPEECANSGNVLRLPGLEANAAATRQRHTDLRAVGRTELPRLRLRLRVCIMSPEPSPALFAVGGEMIATSRKKPVPTVKTAHVRHDHRGRSAAIGAGFHDEKRIPLGVLTDRRLNWFACQRER